MRNAGVYHETIRSKRRQNLTMKKGLKIGYPYLAILFITVLIPCLTSAQEEKEAVRLEQITVTAPGEKEGITITPQSTIIHVEKYKTPGTPQNIVDILKDRAIIDFRGSSDLVETNDNVYMRGFDTRGFVTATDGLSVEKVGGYKGGHFVDFSTIPFGQIESVEIISGPHSALYSSRALGGVINIKTRTPKRCETLKPNFKVMTSYRSYNTQTHRFNVDGGADSFIYDFSYEKYRTNGYLRNNRADIDTISGRFGYILPSDGYISLNVTYQDAKRERPVNNDPKGRYKDYYDGSYPRTESGSNPLDEPRRDKEPYSFRLNIKQPTITGEWKLGAYYSHEDQIYHYEQGKKWRYKTEWNSYGTNIQNEFRLFEDHLVTVGFDFMQLRYRWEKMDESYAGFIQDRWNIIPRLTLTAGLRYEDINIWWNNKNIRSGVYCNPAIQKDEIKKGYHQFVPKSFLTYELDGLSDLLRDTSISAGVSRIWTPKSYCQI